MTLKESIEQERLRLQEARNKAEQEAQAKQAQLSSLISSYIFELQERYLEPMGLCEDLDYRIWESAQDRCIYIRLVDYQLDIKGINIDKTRMILSFPKKLAFDFYEYEPQKDIPFAFGLPSYTLINDGKYRWIYPESVEEFEVELARTIVRYDNNN